MNWFEDALRRLPEPDAGAAAHVRARADDILRPSGALARLDDVAVHIAAWQRTTAPRVERPAALVFAGDHGVAEGGGVNINNVREPSAIRAVTTNDLLFGKHLLLRKGKKNYVVVTAK